MWGEQHTVEGKVPWQPQEAQSGTSPGLTDGQTPLDDPEFTDTSTRWTHKHLYKHGENFHIHRGTKNTRRQDKHRDTSSGQRQINIVSEDEHKEIPLSLFDLSAELRQRKSKGCPRPFVRVNKGDSSSKDFLVSSVQDSAQNRRELPGIDIVCRSARLCFSTHLGHRGPCRPRCETCSEACGGMKGMEGRIQSELTICQITCNAKRCYSPVKNLGTETVWHAWQDS